VLHHKVNDLAANEPLNTKFTAFQELEVHYSCLVALQKGQNPFEDKVSDRCVRVLSVTSLQSRRHKRTASAAATDTDPAQLQSFIECAKTIFVKTLEVRCSSPTVPTHACNLFDFACGHSQLYSYHSLILRGYAPQGFS
jgi:hypothetical protein